MAVKLYNTYSRKLEDFKPLNPKQIGLYTCGPTVYHFAHLGNLRTFIFEDILKRVLSYNGYPVKHVMNITDVGHLTSNSDEGEDKLEKGARREKKTVWEIAKMYTEAFQQDLRALNVLPPQIWCKATDHIPEQIAYIQKIEAKGFTYQTRDGIYFDTSKLPNYGYLARLDIQGLQSGERVALKDKKNPTDFALWKFSPLNERRQMEWASPWGKGFPGWHIECSAMSEKYLGPQFDLHCGGTDHIPVHHTNEIAQAQGATGQIPARWWLHGDFLLQNKEKMAKSNGEFLTLETIKQKGFDPLVYRYFCLTAHYRSKLNYSESALTSAKNSLHKLYAALDNYDDPTEVNTEYQEKFLRIVNHDLNLPGALALMWELIKSDQPSAIKAATLFEFDKIFGLRLAPHFNQTETDKAEIPETVLELAVARQAARGEKDWALADELRKKIIAAGYNIEDIADEYRLRKI